MVLCVLRPLPCELLLEDLVVISSDQNYNAAEVLLYQNNK